MVSDKILIDNHGGGFAEALEETRKVAVFKGLTHKEELHLQLFTEEMLSMIRTVTGETEATFWIECEKGRFDLHMATETVMDKEKRYLLISSTTSKKNEAADSFLGRLRNAFEEAMCSEVERTYFELPAELQGDLTGRAFDDPEWDRYEQSVLLKLADNVSIAIRGKTVDMKVTKYYVD